MLLIVIARILQFTLLLLTLRVATSLLPPSEMGKISLVTATVAFFALLLLNPVGMFINRRMHIWHSKKHVARHLFYFWFYLFAVAVSAMLAVVLAISIGGWRPDMSASYLVALVFFSLLIGTLNQTALPWLNLIGNRGWFASLTVATTLGNLVAAVCLVSFWEGTAEAWMCGLLTGQMVIGVFAIWLFFKKIGGSDVVDTAYVRPDAQNLRALYRFAWPLALAVGLGWVQNQSYRYVVESSMGMAELGLVVAGFAISSGITAGFDSILSSYFQPIFYKKISDPSHEGYDQAWSDYAKSVLPPMVLVALVIALLAADLTKVLLGPEYAASYKFIVWGAFAELARMATAVLGMFAHAKMKTRMLILPNLLGAVLSLGLVWWLVGYWGSIGVGIGLTVASIGAMIASMCKTASYTSLKISSRMTAKILSMCFSLVLASTLLDAVMGEDRSVAMAIARITAIGVLFLIFQVILLRTELQTRPWSGIPDKPLGRV